MIREKVAAHRFVSRLVQVGLARGRRDTVRSLRRRRPGPARVITYNAYGMSGAARATLNLVAHLDSHGEVELISTFRYREDPFFPIPPGVRMTTLDDRRPGIRKSRLRRLLELLPSALVHPDDPLRQRFTAYTDWRLLRAIRSANGGLLLTSRTSFNALAGRFATHTATAIGLEHFSYSFHSPDLLQEIRTSHPDLDAFVALTEADERAFRALFVRRQPRMIRRVPNAVPELPGRPSTQREKRIVGAGRLSQEKGFDSLIEAFARVAAAHPDWQLQIYGEGNHRLDLERLVIEHGVSNIVDLPGSTHDLGTKLAEASIFALPSRFEAFPMVILEAMSKGAAIVSFDCPTGPRQMITHGHDGLLVPAEDVAAMARELDRLMHDPQLTASLGEQARVTAKAYSPAAVGARWDALLDELSGGAGHGAASHTRI